MNANFRGDYSIISSDSSTFSFLFPRGYTMRIEECDHKLWNIVFQGPVPLPPAVQGLRLASDRHELSGLVEVGGLSYFVNISLTKTTAEGKDHQFLYGLVLSAGRSPRPELLGCWAAAEL